MPWFKVDDQFHGHPKTRRASLAALGLWVAAGSYCMAYKTDGVVPVEFVTGWPRGRQLAGELVAVGYWLEHPEGWEFHDWLDYQPSAAEIEAERDAARERQRKSREARRNAKSGRLEPRRTASVTPYVTRDFAVTHAYVTPPGGHTTPTRPDPTRPIYMAGFSCGVAESQNQVAVGRAAESFGFGAAA